MPAARESLRSNGIEPGTGLCPVSDNVDQAINPIPQVGVHARRSLELPRPLYIARWREPPAQNPQQNAMTRSKQPNAGSFFPTVDGTV